MAAKLMISISVICVGVIGASVLLEPQTFVKMTAALFFCIFDLKE